MRRWEKEEVDFLIRYYGKVDIKEIRAELPDRSLGAIKAKAVCLRRKKLLPPLYNDKKDIPDNMRKCNKCGRVLPEEYMSFRRDKLKWNICKECENERRRIKKANERAKKDTEKITQIKQNILKIIEEQKSKSYVCTECNIEKSGTEYYYMKTNGKRISKCKECERKRVKKVDMQRIKGDKDGR